MVESPIVSSSSFPVRVAIIGLGGVAQAHLQAFEILDDVILTAVCDVRVELCESVSKKYRASPFTDYQQLLAQVQDLDLDLVMVLTPASTHRVIVEAVAKAGRHVF